MGSCGDLASADGPLSCGTETEDGLVSELLGGQEAAQTPPSLVANVDQVSTEGSGVPVDSSPGECDKTGSVVLERQGQCSVNVGFENDEQSEANPSSFDGEGSSCEVRVEDLENNDEKGLKASGFDLQEHSPKQVEVEDRICGDFVKLVGETTYDPSAAEAFPEVNQSSTVDGGECDNKEEDAMECMLSSEETVMSPDDCILNDQIGGCPFEASVNLANGQVNDLARVETDSCDITLCPENRETPTEAALSPGYPDQRSLKDEDNTELGIPFVEEAVEVNHLKLSPNETDRVAHIASIEVSPCHTFLGEEEGCRSLKCLFLEEASVEMMRENILVAEPDREIGRENSSFQSDEMTDEDKKIANILPQKPDMSCDSDTLAGSSLINDTAVGTRLEADLQNEAPISPVHEIPSEISDVHHCVADSIPLNEKKTEGSRVSSPPSGAAQVGGGEDSNVVQETNVEHVGEENPLLLDKVIEYSSGSLHSKEHADTDGRHCVTDSMPSNEKKTEGSHVSCSLSSAAPVGGGEDSDVVRETNVEQVGEENPLLLDKVTEGSSGLLHFKEHAVSSERLSGLSPHSSVKNCLSKFSNDLDLPVLSVSVRTTSNSANNYTSEASDERKNDGILVSVPGTESRVVIASSSRRSGRINKSGRKTQAKRTSKHSRDASKLSYPHEAIFKSAKKKRTFCSKAPRSSVWGVLQNVSRHFEHMNEYVIEPDQNEGTCSHGRKCAKESRNKSGGTSQVSKGNPGGSSNRIRLKLKMGKEVVVISSVVSTGRGTFAPASSGGSISKAANLTNDVNKIDQLEIVDAKMKCDEPHSGDPLANGDSIFPAKESVQDGGGFRDSAIAGVESVRRTVEDTYLGSETSPDSEVINLMPETQLNGRPLEGMKDIALECSKSLATIEVLNSKKGKKNDKVPPKSGSAQKGKSSSGSLSSSKRRGSRVKVDENVCRGENDSSLAIANQPNNTGSLLLSSGDDLTFFNGGLHIENGTDTFPCQDINIGSRDLDSLNNKSVSGEMKGQKQGKNSKAGGASRGRSKKLNACMSRKGASCKQKKEKSNSKSKGNEKVVNAQSHEDHALAGAALTRSDLKNDAAAHMWTCITSKSEIISDHHKEQLPPRNAWVRCDDCYKWRRIAAALADSIEDTNSSWTCKDNLDKRFADCTIPQEMSNAEINAELELSDYSGEDDDNDGNKNYKELKYSRSSVPQQASFIQIDSNKFLHRSRKTQTIDEIMVCHCKPPIDGSLGCQDECLNRMLNIECVQGTCPCGDLCSNQQFQKRKYAELQWFRCGKKGYGLQLREDVPAGEFIIEYIGEVLDLPAYEERQRNYAAMGHKHFYFMTLNGSEVIDACVKGNLGRFINHSCDPNCRTEKWVVNGEICIGLFAIRDIRKGEELTFDYNYVRVFGAAAKKCVCGSPLCRGYIGGDLQSSETIVQGDSDDEFPEPVMFDETGKVACRFKDPMPLTLGEPDLYNRNEDLNYLDENTLEIKDMASRNYVLGTPKLEKSFEAGIRQGKLPVLKSSHQELLHSEDLKSKVASEFQRKIFTEDSSNLSYNNVPEKDGQPGRSVSDEKQILEETRPPAKAPRASIIVKKGKGNNKLPNVNKGQGMASKAPVVLIKHKKSIEGSANGRFEAVQEKLNELLDADGGISKKKDAAKGYLKLLLLTAASGDSGNGEAIQSNRDLSMILDVLLKTRSRIVLMDIINKNGLRMLHNIMKQYRGDFKKIPILRKLLKVLEYLAAREILTLEHINVGPPCPGMESFKESILSLTEHEDKQVHQIARNFRDRFIPRHLRKFGCVDRDDGMNSIVRGLSLNFLSSHGGWRDSSLTRSVEASDRLHQPSVSAANSSATDNSSKDGGSTAGTQIRKRKSRWDSDSNPFLESLKHKDKDIANKAEGGSERNYAEEGPPGFSSPLDTSRVSSNGATTTSAMDQSVEKVQYMRCPFDAVIGQPQERFKSQSPVSYGVPLMVLQQFGTPQAGSIENWAVGPGMPFQPFPPLPPYPRDRKRRSPPSSSDYSSSCSLQSSGDEKKHENLCQSSSSANLEDPGVPCSENQSTMPFKRFKGSSQDLGRRYFKQQKWNSGKIPPWVRSWRNNSSKSSTGTVSNELNTSDNADVNFKLEGGE